VELPFDSIGISDILDYRECPQRFAFKMRRHSPLPERFALFEGEKDAPPESIDWTNAYGSAIHEAISHVERGLRDEEAVQLAWNEYGPWLDPEHLTMLREDIETFHTRTQLGWRVVAVEQDMKVPLFVYKGRQIYFRFKCDALYQHMQRPGLFLSRDYKSSAHRKSNEEVQKDLQQWAYNWGLHEMFPEIEELQQEYDQLRFGIEPTGKTADERAEIKRWLIAQVTSILDDMTLAPKQNQWCPYCPIMMDCRVTHLSADWWKARIEAIAPEKKVGRKVVMQLTDDSEGFAYYVEILPRVEVTLKMLKRFRDNVHEALSEMPSDERKSLGYGTRQKRGTQFSASALRRIHAKTQDTFYQLVGLTKTRVEDMYGKGKKADPIAAEILAEGTEIVASEYVTRIGD
jgi:hypothetical protein